MLCVSSYQHVNLEYAICLFFFLAQIENLVAKKDQIQLPQKSQDKPRGDQEIMPIWGLTFDVTTKLL